MTLYVKILQGLRVDNAGLTYFRRVCIPAEGLLKSHRPFFCLSARKKQLKNADADFDHWLLDNFAENVEPSQV